MTFFIILSAIPVTISKDQIDISTLDTIMGSVAGAVATTIVFFVVGYLLVKFGIVNFGKAVAEYNSASRPVCFEHTGLVKDISFVVDECKSIWLEIKEINHRQMQLRTRLPAEYVTKDDLKSIQERLKSIDSKLDRYFELHSVK